MIDAELVELLACPWCARAPLEVYIDDGDAGDIKTGRLVCPSGDHAFPIRNGMPALLPPGVAPDLAVDDPHYRLWRRKLANFMAWREMTYGTVSPQAAPGEDAAHLAFQRSFLEFGDLRRLKRAGALVLDVGSAAGAIRPLIGPGWRYCGLDPLPILPVYDYWMVQAVGERMPFRQSSFDAILIMQTLDHCANAGQLLDEAHRLLRPDGVLLLQQVVNRARRRGFRSRLKQACKRWLRPGQADPTDSKMVNFSPQSLEQLVGRTFKVVDLRLHERQHAFVKALRTRIA